MRKIYENEYYLGLDIGTDSVGFAVTDEDYKVMKFNQKSMWGIRLFDSAKTAEERRLFRTNVRRLDRRHWRIQLLQELFATEISKVDIGFFRRLKDSALFPEDKEYKQIYSLFLDKDYNDVNYHKDFPTIYHLRKELIIGKREYDVRLVYLALHHIMKHRGHFLFSGSIQNATSFGYTYELFKDCLKNEFDIQLECGSLTELEEVLKSKSLTKKDKNAKAIQLFGCSKGDKQLKAIIGLICGSKCKLADVFGDEGLLEIERPSISFSESPYDDIRPELEEKLQERCGILDIIKSMYDWAILADILHSGEMDGQCYLSVAKVNSYEEHHKDLQVLKRVIRKYSHDVYKSFFSSTQSGNYCTYIGHFTKSKKKTSLKKCTKEEFYKSVKRIIESAKKEIGEDRDIIYIEEKLANDTFLPLQVNKDNGVIPYQVHDMELKRILKNAEKYLGFLTKKDESGFTVSDKIIKLFNFRIPYYVGPINTNAGENSWMVRKSDDNIRPWNFEKIVDVDKSAEKFIRRMTNKCTYLVGKDVLPKNSLLYSEYMLWNELNNVRIDGEKWSIELKQGFYETVCKNKRRVTGKMLLNYLKSVGMEVKREDISGFDHNFKSSLAVYLDFKKIFGDEINHYKIRNMTEEIILWITLYNDEIKMLKRVIRNHYSDNEITDEQLEKIVKLKYQGWGRFSKEFLEEVEGVDRETGECFNVIQALRNTNDNLMQLLGQKYTFNENIKNLNSSNIEEVEEITYDALIKDMVVSPAIKRSIWQVVQIVEEVKKIMGKEPKKIFIEVARSHEESKRTISRKDKLLHLYEKCKEESRDWKKELENIPESTFRSIKLYLYYTQMGKCMYSQESIDLSRLADTTVYDKDHIYPQSLTKDDSLDNLVLVKRVLNANKSNNVLSQKTQNKMCGFWKQLKEKGFISEEKYNRLMRKTPLTDEERAGFINRQLVETRQSTKVVADLFKRLYTSSEIVYVKAKAVSDFRDKELETVKVREMNDLHHAKDAYLNIVVGNVYYEKFTNNPLQWLKNTKDKNYSLNQMFNNDLLKGDRIIWQSGKMGTIASVRKQMKKNDVLYTRYATCNKGAFFDQQIKSPDENPTVPIKKGMDTKRYGGYKGVNPAYFTLVESEDKKGNQIRTIEAVPLYLEKDFQKDESLYLEYCIVNYGLNNPRIVISRIKKNAKMIIDGFPMHLRGTTGKQLILQGAVQLCLNEEGTRYLKKVEKYIQRNLMKKDKKSLLTLEEYDGISKEENIKLYDLFCDKQEKTIYQYRPAKQVDKLKAGRDNFISLSREEQCIVLNEILKLMQCKNIKADLETYGMGGSKNAGNIAISKMVSSRKSAKLIHQSVTGLFEQEIDLLTI